jgi:hypothetical protein
MRLAVSENDSGLVLLEAELGDLKIGREINLLQFPKKLDGDMLVDIKAMSKRRHEPASTSIVLEKTPGESRLDQSYKFRFKFPDKKNRFGDFVFGWPVGKNICWLGVIHSQVSGSDEFSAIGSAWLLRTRFTWFDVDEKSLAPVLAEYREKSNEKSPQLSKDSDVRNTAFQEGFEGDNSSRQSSAEIVSSAAEDKVSNHLECPRKECSGTMKLEDVNGQLTYICSNSPRCRMAIKYPFKCFLCDAPMVLRDGKNGKFWGCSEYPNCKHTDDYR